MGDKYRITYTNHPFREEVSAELDLAEEISTETNLEYAVRIGREKANGTNAFDIDEWDDDGWRRIVTRGIMVKSDPPQIVDVTKIVEGK